MTSKYILFYSNCTAELSFSIIHPWRHNGYQRNCLLLRFGGALLLAPIPFGQGSNQVVNNRDWLAGEVASGSPGRLVGCYAGSGTSCPLFPWGS
ncbi:hypothetical protein IF1G_03171 [Cordyceps javanica]|uniref:Uncharacterized protein n=1 Tax=Cordyceps javanica TaxID=43265 RepID=A0A545V6U6_9HYPO|nr:hypothetical protein IF1G_03171 [Cordyceps javanica]